MWRDHSYQEHEARAWVKGPATEGGLGPHTALCVGSWPRCIWRLRLEAT